MKNITVSVDDEVYRQARIKAAEANTSVSGLVRDYLIEIARKGETESEFERLKRLQHETLAAINARQPAFRAADNVPRDQLHDRDALR
jgi:hypothetical protein